MIDSFTFLEKIKKSPKLSQMGDWIVIFEAIGHRMKEQVARLVREPSAGVAV
ncbi:hypothetical protein D3C75_1262880 [compost metagenome]